MTVAELLPGLAQATIILATLITLFDFIRYRDRPRFDVFLMFGDLALIVVTQLLNLALEPDLPWLGVLNSILLMAHPYLLLRLVQHLRPISPPVRSFAIIGLIFSWLAILLLGSPIPTIAAVLLVIYFIIVEGYAVAAIIRGAMVTSGVTHWRLLLAAVGSGLIGAVILIAGLIAVLPSAASTLSPVSQVIGLLSLLCYFFGFATPEWLRRYWQLSELYRFLIQGSGRAWTGEQGGEALRSYCQAAERAVGGSGALVLLWDQDEKQLKVRASSAQDESIDRSQIKTLTLERIWREGKSRVLRIPEDYQPAELTSSHSGTARALLVVVIATRERSWGLLVVYLLRTPIFASDDLALLDLFSEQTGAALDYGALLASLEQRVDDRTKQLQEAVESLEQEIAARKGAEGAVQRLNRDLQHRALELKAANKELEAFAYSVSHDLRAPLRAIDGFSRVLMTKFASSLEGDALRYLGLVRENTQQMGELIDDLLAFSRLSRQSLNKQLVDPGELVRNALHDLLNNQGDRLIEVVVGDLPPFVADPNLLRQVYVNLLSNAIKYSSKSDHPRIEVGYLERDGERVYFVKDNGVGFDMQYADKLFGVFQRLHPADEFEGTGVGLAIIHRIITRHGGRVWAEAEVDKGATFYFTLGTPEPQQLEETSPAG